MAFDPEARATSLPSGVSAGYRSDGLRAWKSSGGTTTYYLYDGGEPVVELDSSGNVKAYDVYAPDGLVARQQTPTLATGHGGTSGLTAIVGGQTQYCFDPEGNVAQRLDSAGNVFSSSAYGGGELDVHAHGSLRVPRAGRLRPGPRGRGCTSARTGTTTRGREGGPQGTPSATAGASTCTGTAREGRWGTRTPRGS